MAQDGQAVNFADLVKHHLCCCCSAAILGQHGLRDGSQFLFDCDAALVLVVTPPVVDARLAAKADEVYGIAG